MGGDEAWAVAHRGCPPPKIRWVHFVTGARMLRPLEPALPSPGALLSAINICPSNCDFQMNKPISVATSS